MTLIEALADPSLTEATTLEEEYQLNIYSNGIGRYYEPVDFHITKFPDHNKLTHNCKDKLIPFTMGEIDIEYKKNDYPEYNVFMVHTITSIFYPLGTIITLVSGLRLKVVSYSAVVRYNGIQHVNVYTVLDKGFDAPVYTIANEKICNKILSNINNIYVYDEDLKHILPNYVSVLATKESSYKQFSEDVINSVNRYWANKMNPWYKYVMDRYAEINDIHITDRFALNLAYDLTFHENRTPVTISYGDEVYRASLPIMLYKFLVWLMLNPKEYFGDQLRAINYNNFIIRSNNAKFEDNKLEITIDSIEEDNFDMNLINFTFKTPEASEYDYRITAKCNLDVIENNTFAIHEVVPSLHVYKITKGEEPETEEIPVEGINNNPITNDVYTNPVGLHTANAVVSNFTTLINLIDVISGVRTAIGTMEETYFNNLPEYIRTANWPTIFIIN